MRAYNTKPVVWDAKDGCEHRWGTEIIQKQSGGTEKTTVGNFKDDKIHYQVASQFCSLCGAWRGELGLEPTPALYIKHICDVFDGVKRVLRDDGCLWVNMGDAYANTGYGKQTGHFRQRGNPAVEKAKLRIGLPAKCMCLMPERFAIEMCNRGWILRNVIIWAKGTSFSDKYSGSCMPDSAKDRFNKNGFEYIYFFVKKKRYWFEQQYEPMTESNPERPRMGQGQQTIYNQKRKEARYQRGPKREKFGFKQDIHNPLGRVLRNVWLINPEAFSEAHFATFPKAIVRPCLLASCPEFVCKKCGKGRSKIIKTKGGTIGKSWHNHKADQESGMSQKKPELNLIGHTHKKTLIGLTDCGCGKGFRPGIALDPFMGSGTVALVAYENRRDYIGIELQPDYIEIAEKRLAEARAEFGLFEKEK